MKRQPEIIVDECLTCRGFGTIGDSHDTAGTECPDCNGKGGTTWALMGVHNGKAYYGKIDTLQAPVEIPKIEFDMPPAPMLGYHFAHHLITPPRPTIVITGI